MTVEAYKTQFESFADDVEVNTTEAFLNKLAKRGKELEAESDFTLDDIKEELLDVVPVRFQKDIDWLTLIDECAMFVFDEKEENGDEDLSYE